MLLAAHNGASRLQNGIARYGLTERLPSVSLSGLATLSTDSTPSAAATHISQRQRGPAG